MESFDLPVNEQEDRNVVLCLYALYDAGICEPTAGRLARLPHVTPEFINAHVELANAQGFTLSIAIYRIEHAWPLPQRRTVLTVEDHIRRFLGQDAQPDRKNSKAGASSLPIGEGREPR